jgi:SET domain-containing protein
MPSNREIILNTKSEYIQFSVECNFIVKNYVTGKNIKFINMKICLESKIKIRDIININTLKKVDDIMNSSGLLLWREI